MLAWRAPLAPARVRRALTAQRFDVATVLATLALQTALYLVPLAAVFPAHTLVTGNFVCNDSVAHAVLMRGFGVVHGLYGAWTHYSIYPDAFHAVMFGLRGALPADAPSYLLPASIWNRSKMGFGVPLDYWFRNELRQLTQDTLLDPAARCLAYFRRDTIERLIHEHTHRLYDHAPRLWLLMFFELWLRRWCG